MSQKRVFWLAMINLALLIAASIYSIIAKDWEVLKVNIPLLGRYSFRYNIYGASIHLMCFTGYFLLMGKMITSTSNSHTENILDDNE